MTDSGNGTSRNGEHAPSNPLFERWHIDPQAADFARMRRLILISLEPSFAQARAALGSLMASVDSAYGKLGEVEWRLDALAARLERSAQDAHEAPSAPGSRDTDTAPVVDASRAIDQIAFSLSLLERVLASGPDRPVDVAECLPTAASLAIAVTQDVGGVRWQSPSQPCLVNASRAVVVAVIAVALRGVAELLTVGTDADLRVKVEATEGVIAISIMTASADAFTMGHVAEALRSLVEPWARIGIASRAGELVVAIPTVAADDATGGAHPSLPAARSTSDGAAIALCRIERRRVNARWGYAAASERPAWPATP